MKRNILFVLLFPVYLLATKTPKRNGKFPWVEKGKYQLLLCERCKVGGKTCKGHVYLTEKCSGKDTDKNVTEGWFPIHAVRGRKDKIVEADLNKTGNYIAIIESDLAGKKRSIRVRGRRDKRYPYCDILDESIPEDVKVLGLEFTTKGLAFRFATKINNKLQYITRITSYRRLRDSYFKKRLERK